MTLDQLRPVANRLLEPFVDLSERLGLTPDAISAVAFVVALAAGGAFVLAGETPILYFVGAILVFLNGWLDLLDGALARRIDQASPAGDLLDHVLDRYADVLIIAGLTAGVEQYAIGFAAITGVLLTSYLGTQIQAVGLGRAYGGLLGRADRLVLVAVVATVQAFVPLSLFDLTLVGWLLVLFAVVGHFTAIQRFYLGWRDLQDEQAKQEALDAVEARESETMAGESAEEADESVAAEDEDCSRTERETDDSSAEKRESLDDDRTPGGPTDSDD